MRFSVLVARIYCVSLFVSFLTTGCAWFRPKEPPKEPVTFSERLDRILKGKSSKAQVALDTLLSGKTMPVYEGAKCFFFYKATPNRTVAVAGDWNAWDAGADILQPIPKTDYYFLTKEFPLNARLDYQIVDNGKRMTDPRNPRTCEGESGPNSEIAMPEYQEPDELNVPDDVPEGVLEEMVFESTILSGTRALSIYLPPAYGREYGPHPFLIVQDGAEFIRLANFPRVVDFLIQKQKIRRVVLVFVEPPLKLTQAIVKPGVPGSRFGNAANRSTISRVSDKSNVRRRFPSAICPIGNCGDLSLLSSLARSMPTISAICVAVNLGAILRGCGANISALTES